MTDRPAANPLLMMTAAQRQAEEQRQVQIVASAIDAAIKETAQLFEAPLLNAVCGALVTVEASVLAAMCPEHRKMMRRSMDKARPKALADALSKSPALATVVTVRRHDS